MKYGMLSSLVVTLGLLTSNLPPTFASSEATTNFKSRTLLAQKSINSENQRDRKLEIAILKSNSYYDSATANLPVFYGYRKIDLNGDKRPETIVHLAGIPFCGTGGCTTLIFRKVANRYKLVSKIGLNHPPIIISNNKTNGWNDLIIAQFQGSNRGYHGYYALKFNGRTYPVNPINGTKLPQKTKLTGRRLFENGLSFELRPLSANQRQQPSQNSNSKYPLGNFQNNKWLISLRLENNQLTYTGRSRKDGKSLYLKGSRISGNNQRKIFTWNNGNYRYQVIWQPNDPNYIRLKVLNSGRELLNELLSKSGNISNQNNTQAAKTRKIVIKDNGYSFDVPNWARVIRNGKTLEVLTQKSYEQRMRGNKKCMYQDSSILGCSEFDITIEKNGRKKLAEAHKGLLNPCGGLRCGLSLISYTDNIVVNGKAYRKYELVDEHGKWDMYLYLTQENYLVTFSLNKEPYAGNEVALKTVMGSFSR